MALDSQPTSLNEWLVYWLEIHPASDGEVKVVLAKLEWLKNWLRTKAPNSPLWPDRNALQDVAMSCHRSADWKGSCTRRR
jgi:hypothetical protein